MFCKKFVWFFLTTFAGYLAGCADIQGHEPTIRQATAIQAAKNAWSQDCSGVDDVHLTVLELSSGRVNELCGQAAFACLIDDVIVLREEFLGTDSELTLTVHETIHTLAGVCGSGLDYYHKNVEFWIKPDRCLQLSVEGRARLSLMLDGCNIAPSEVCC